MTDSDIKPLLAGTAAPTADDWVRWNNVKRAAIVISQLRLGGAERVVVHLAGRLSACGVEPLVICIQEKGELATELEHSGVRVVAMRSLRGYDLGGAFRLAWQLAKFRPSVINVHDRASLPYVALANLLGLHGPVVFSAHGFLFRDFDKPRMKYRLAARRLSGMTAESSNVAARYVQHLGWSGDVDIVPNGVPVTPRSDHTRSRTRQSLGVPDDRFVFISVGNAKPEKGFEDLLDAAALLHRQGPPRPFLCWIVGSVAESEYQAGLLAKHQQLGLDGVVQFLGFQPDVQALYQAADAFLLPSRSEGLPMALLEAMMAGLPVIATRVGAIPDVVTDETGMITEVQAPDTLSPAMARFLADPQSSRVMGRKARQRAVAEYSVQRMASRYLQTFERAVSGKFRKVKS